jgi:glycosyltransferase involved in cell wall biosynthesis
MKLLVIWGDLRSRTDEAHAARAYGDLLGGLFDRVVGVDIPLSPPRRCNPFPYPLIAEAEAQALAAQARFTLALSCTTPDRYLRCPGAVNVGLTGWPTDQLPGSAARPSPWVAALNAMDALWVPCCHTRDVFVAAGVTAPVRVIPCPLAAPGDSRLPGGELYDLDRAPFCGGALAGIARFKGNRFRLTRRLMRQVGPSVTRSLLARLRVKKGTQLFSAGQTVACFAQDGERNGLWLLLAEWMEFKRRPAAAPWRLLIQTGALDWRLPAGDLVLPIWEQVQALKRQLGVARADTLLWTGELTDAGVDGLLGHVTACVVPSLGERFPGPAVRALALGKPVVTGRHTVFADCVPADYPYTFATTPTMVSFVRDTQRGDYDPVSRWAVPVPFAVADALTRLAADLAAARAEVGRRAGAYLEAWCGRDRVRQLLADELERLMVRHSQPTAPPPILRSGAKRQPPSAGRRPGRRSSAPS